MRYEAPSDYPAVRNPALDKTLGYLYFMDKEHPLATKQGRVYYHRHVLSLKLGRWLESGEVTHHKDKDRTNNNPENLGLTTPSDHARSHALERASTAKITGANRPIPFSKCYECGRVFRRPRATSKCCSQSCGQKSRERKRRFDPSPEELQALVWEMPTLRVAELFGVSDAAVAKRCKKYSIKKPPRGYWMKNPYKPS